MAKTILVTGGFASGKSRWVVTQYQAIDYVLYLCPDEVMDPDIRQRIAYSNQKNYVEWDIQTGISEDLYTYINDHKFVVLDSLASYARIVMDKMCPNTEELNEEMIKAIAKMIIDNIAAMYDVIRAKDGNMTIVTLETGFSAIPQDPREAAFSKIMGIVNQRIANISTEVFMSVSGIQFQIR